MTYHMNKFHWVRTIVRTLTAGSKSVGNKGQNNQPSRVMNIFATFFRFFVVVIQTSLKIYLCMHFHSSPKEEEEEETTLLFTCSRQLKKIKHLETTIFCYSPVLGNLKIILNIWKHANNTRQLHKCSSNLWNHDNFYLWLSSYCYLSVLANFIKLLQKHLEPWQYLYLWLPSYSSFLEPWQHILIMITITL